MKLTINLVVQNGEKYIPFLFASLKRQIFKEWELLVWDNASTDKTVEMVEKEMTVSGIKFRIIKSTENIGFSGGHNKLYKEVQTPYFLLQNVDMYLMPDALEKMVNFLDSHPETVSVAPRLMRWDFEKVQADLNNGSDVVGAAKAGFTSQIDAIGIKLFRNRRAVEWLTKQTWAKDSENADVREIFDKPVQEVFGVSGAFPIYRKSITDKVLLPGDCIFDPTYHSYKEDLDLAYRLRNAGFVSYVLLDTVSFHDRTGAGPKAMSDLAAITNKFKQPYFVAFHSYKNHLRTLYKNEYWQNFLIDFPVIFLYELKKFIYLLIFSPAVVLNGLWEIFKTWGYMRIARVAVLKSRRLHWKGIRRWL
ncbi:glycosyltransferase [Patescibacteria group bacterium]|nr:glycosyltransferase [Patescibacteria group bacterium]